MTIPAVVLQELIELGRGERNGVPPSLTREREAWDTLARSSTTWHSVAIALEAAELEALIRGLLTYSKVSGRQIGGSCSPVIELYRVFTEVAPECEPELTAWIVANRTDSYEPFGSGNDEQATSLAEYISRRDARARRVQERQQQARDLRAIRDRKESTEKLAAAVRRGDLSAVKALLSKGADVTKAISGGGSLVDLAEEHGRTAVADHLRSVGLE